MGHGPRKCRQVGGGLCSFCFVTGHRSAKRLGDTHGAQSVIGASVKKCATAKMTGEAAPSASNDQEQRSFTLKLQSSKESKDSKRSVASCTSGPCTC